MMKKLVFLLVIYSACFCYCHSQVIFSKPLSERQTGYNIKARLDAAEKSIDGEMKSFWVNKSPDIVNNVQLHMYLNAFRNGRSTLYKETRSSVILNKESAGAIDIISIKDHNGADLIDSMQFISPDDGNPDDMTVLKINLSEPAKPGDTVMLDINFKSKLPSGSRRTGYKDDFYFVAQWFPKFGVYEPAGMRYALKGGWNCHQFHLNSEFYSNHSVYEVQINLPEEFVAGSCGQLVNESADGNGRKTITYRAEDIVDFAWTAWPGYAVYNDEWKNIKITLLIPPERKNQVERQFTAVKNALDYFEKCVGPYPWPHLTFVDPPSIGGFSEEMEYTTMFTSSSSYAMPEFMHMPEMVTIHEFGHAYFMGILASNEFEEPGLDEGVNTYWEGRIVDHFYGENSGLINHPFLKISDRTLPRIDYILSGSRQAASNREYSWNYPHGTYSMMSYHKVSVILQTLEGILGEETMNEIFREYYRQWSFRHPSGKDFINVASNVTAKIHGTKFGKDLNWFFDQTIYGTGISDYKVYNVYSRSISDGVDSASMKSDSSKVYCSYVELERTGDVILPVDVLVHFDNGDELREEWDGSSRTKDFIYTGNRKVEWAKIDPDFKIKMDVNYINNSKTIKPDRIPVRRMSNKLLSFMQFFMTFITL